MPPWEAVVFAPAEREEMKYNKGDPPSIGWWPTSPLVLRWWDGENWSWPCMDSDNIYYVKYYSGKVDPVQMGIRWADRPSNWPESSKT